MLRMSSCFDERHAWLTATDPNDVDLMRYGESTLRETQKWFKIFADEAPALWDTKHKDFGDELVRKQLLTGFGRRLGMGGKNG